MFLENDKTTSRNQFDDEDNEDSSREFIENQAGKIQLQGNIIPPYFLSLEKLFNRHDAYIKQKRVKKGPTTGEYEGVNIGDVDNPKKIKIGKCCSWEEKEAARLLFIEYQHVFFLELWRFEKL